MRRLCRSIFLVAIAAPLLLQAAETGHDVCASCHGREVLGAGQSVPDSSRCLDCHSMEDLAGPTAPRNDPWPGHMWPEAARIDPGEGFAYPREADCLSCHDPHARDGQGSLRDVASAAEVDRASRLCLGCHGDRADLVGSGGNYSRHPIGIEIPGGPPEISEILPVPVYDLHGTESRDDDVVSCITCHTAHARRGENQMRWSSADETTAACASCHQMHEQASGEAWREGLRRRGR